MKRDAYGDDGPSMKRSRDPDDEVTFVIPSKVAGSIIGKGGANITKLRNQAGWGCLGVAPGGYSVCWLPVPPRPAAPAAAAPLSTQYKASITVPDCPGPERVLSIAAPDVETVLDVVRDVLPNLADGNPKGMDELDVRLLIHQSRAGCVIGKAGAKIKELREKTGARLKIFSSPAPQSTERVVQLFGGPEAVIAAVREVLDLTRQVPIKGPIEAYDPHNYDDYYADEYGGYGGSGGGGQMRGGRGGGDRGGRDGGAGRGPPRRGPPPPHGPPSMPPRRGPPGPPRFNDFGGPGPRGKFNGPPPPFGGDFGGDFGGFGSRAPPASFGESDQETTTQVTIPKDLAGAIIGKAGSKIRKIRADSGAGIEIAEPLPGADDRIITITGSAHCIKMAQYLLQQSVHESNPNLGRGNY